MSLIDPLGLSANQWQFLSRPEDYVRASEGRLLLESTRRQFRTAADILARINGSFRSPALRGVLLADDVGLGKTQVGALVAWVVASAGPMRGVRILAPNEVMARRWEEELKSHVDLLNACAPTLMADSRRVKRGKVGRLTVGSIQVVKHSYAAKDNLTCDLLIIDEAHRAKGEHTAFTSALKRQRKLAGRVLILTATPFSIRLAELERMLALVGGDSAQAPVRAFSRFLDELYDGNSVRDPEAVGNRLAVKATAAVEALSTCVIRHSIDELLSREVCSFGRSEEWSLPVPPATEDEIEIVFRLDRALRVATREKGEPGKATNDPRFHVGWRHLDAKRTELERKSLFLCEPARSVVQNHIASIGRLRKTAGVHSKMQAVASAVQGTVEHGEKVLLFCHHHATAQELTAHLAAVLPPLQTSRVPHASTWRNAWEEVVCRVGGVPGEDALRETFIGWLSARSIRAQTWGWLPGEPLVSADLASAFRTARARGQSGAETIAVAAQRLYRSMLQSKSSRGVLRAAAAGRLELIPGGKDQMRVLGVCEPSDVDGEEPLFIHNQQPDTVIAVFNSPFGPDVLVATDKLSEGIDLHRYCRHLIHYELDPSPIRTVQRNGRIRRVNSWAAATGQPIRYAYPALGGTRDHRLVQIMKKRVDSFSLLLGGVHDFDADSVCEGDEKWRSEVIGFAKGRLAAAGGRLRARVPH